MTNANLTVRAPLQSIIFQPLIFNSHDSFIGILWHPSGVQNVF